MYVVTVMKMICRPLYKKLIRVGNILRFNTAGFWNTWMWLIEKRVAQIAATIKRSQPTDLFKNINRINTSMEFHGYTLENMWSFSGTPWQRLCRLHNRSSGRNINEITRMEYRKYDTINHHDLIARI